MLTRRKFLRLCLNTAASATLAQMLLPELAEALRLIPGGKPPVIWIEGTSCTGNSISLDNIADPSLRTVFEEIIDLRYQQLTMWPQSYQAMDVLHETKEKERGRYILVVEGGIPMGLPESVIVGERDGIQLNARDTIPWLAEDAMAVVAVGNCAAFGGPSKAYPNPTGTKGVWNVVTNTPVINVPGCPAHPDWMVGTIVHIILYGLPRVDEFRRPTMFFGQLVHDICPRRFFFFNGDFANAPGEAGCLFKVGCKGPVTHADCPTRKFNDGINWCINANNPCIGCATPDFPDGGTSPFFEHLTDIRVLPGIETTAVTVTKGVGAATALGIGAHFAVNLAKGRLGNNLTLETEKEIPVPTDNPYSAIKDELETERNALIKIEAEQILMQQDIKQIRRLQNQGRAGKSLLSKLNPLRFFRKKNKL
ncbi:MAG: hydrogenase small subunit [Clostridiales bacterium]|nr:hydrogenase small subunit [Clostridiales bacterium]